MEYLILILAVLIGTGMVFIFKPSEILTRLLLSFSGAYLLSITVLHLLPEVYSIHDKEINVKVVGICILLGILMQSILESLSKGAEHGHVHFHKDDSKFPWLLFISLCLHAFTEGLPIHHSHNPVQDSHNLLWAIFVHKIPIAIVLTSFFKRSSIAIPKIVAFMVVFSLMSPLGLLASHHSTFLEKYHIEITAFVIGVFFHISTIILFESSENHRFNLKKFLAIIAGILLTVLTL